MVKGMRIDGFDWGAAWELDELSSVYFIEEVRSATNPAATYEIFTGERMPSGAGVPTAKAMTEYRVYMKAVQAALDSPPESAGGQIAALDAQKRALPVLVQRAIPNAQKENDARLEVVAARKELLDALANS